MMRTTHLHSFYRIFAHIAAALRAFLRLVALCALFRVGAVAVRTEPFACTMMRTFSRRTLIACAFGAYDALMRAVCLLA